MKTLVLLTALTMPALAFAGRYAPGPRIDLNAKPHTLAALKNRKALIEIQDRQYRANHPAVMHVNPPGSTLQFGKRW